MLIMLKIQLNHILNLKHRHIEIYRNVIPGIWNRYMPGDCNVFVRKKLYRRRNKQLKYCTCTILCFSWNNCSLGISTISENCILMSEISMSESLL